MILCYGSSRKSIKVSSALCKFIKSALKYTHLWVRKLVQELAGINDLPCIINTNKHIFCISQIALNDILNLFCNDNFVLPQIAIVWWWEPTALESAPDGVASIWCMFSFACLHASKSLKTAKAFRSSCEALRTDICEKRSLE